MSASRAGSLGEAVRWKRSARLASPIAPTTGRACFLADSASGSPSLGRSSADPTFFLGAEPFGALDALTRIEMHRLLERLWREFRFTAVLITHDVAEAIALGD